METSVYLEKILTDILKVVPNAVIVIDDENKIVFFNEGAEKMLGYMAEEVVGSSISRIVPEELQEGFNEQTLNFLGHGRVVQRRKADGSLIPVHLAVEKIVKQRREYLVGVMVDLTEYEKLQHQITINQERYQVAQDCAHIGMWEWTIATGELYWSEKIAPMFGHKPGTLETSYENFQAAIHPDDRDMVNEAVAACVEQGEVYDVEHRVIWPDGNVRWVSERGGVSDKKGEPLKMLGVVQDITLKKEMEEALIEAKEEAENGARAKSIFLANMSHEIRTPMNAILGFTDLLIESDCTPEQKAQLSTVRNSARSLLTILNDILDVSKLESGKLAIENTVYNLPHVLKETLQTLHVKAQEKALELSLDVAPDLYRCVLGDPTRLRQVLINLVGNAIKFTPSGTVEVLVELKTEDTGEGTMVFQVKDSGIGMTPEQLDMIFDPFTQAEDSTSRQFGGTGLGTTISLQLVELMGGKIWAESQSGLGSSFFFTLPLAKPDCATLCSEQCVALEESGDLILPVSERQFQVLLVEDIQVNVDLAKLRLEQQGHQVTVATNGLEAVEAAEEQIFDLILMDVQMPKMDGLEATREIRRKGKNRETSIIALTASVLEKEMDSCITAGMDAVAGKPIEFGRLFKLIDSTVPEGKGVKMGKMEVEISTESEFQLPHLEGVDIKKGLRTWKNPRLYAKSLKKFTEDYCQISGKIKACLENKKYDDAYALIHALKGVSGNLSVEKVSALSTALTLLIKAKKYTSMEGPLGQLQKEFDSLKTQMDTIDLKKEEAPKRAFDSSQVTTLLQNMLNGLEEDDPAIVEPLIDELETFLPESQLGPLRNTIEDFNFDEAKTITRSMMENMSTVQGEAQ